MLGSVLVRSRVVMPQAGTPSNPGQGAESRLMVIAGNVDTLFPLHDLAAGMGIISWLGLSLARGVCARAVLYQPADAGAVT